MSKDIIMSVKPKWFDLIASGQKIVEVRTTRPSHGCNALWFYVSGTGSILGKATSFLIFRFNTSEEYVAKKACLSIEQLKDYAKGRAYLCGWVITNFQPVSLSLSDFGLKRPPMSWRYVSSIDGDHTKEVQE